MQDTPLILLIGDDRLTERVCAEITATTGHRVRIMWALGAERQEAFRKLGATVTPLAPDSDEALHAAGVTEAASILTLSGDDGLNLSVALRARVLNPNIRLVLRQFDTLLGRKLEENLANCTVLSQASHAASTYAGAALDPSCIFAIRFPEVDGPLVGFTVNSAADLGIDGLSVAESERRLRGRIAALGSREDPAAETVVSSDDRVTLFGPIAERRRVAPVGDAGGRTTDAAPPRRPLGIRDGLAALARINPILRILAGTALAFVIFSFSFFHFVLGSSGTAAAFYVVETMTNFDSGEVGAVTARGPIVTAAAIVAVLGGVLFTSLFIGYVSSAVTRAQWIALQGLRHIRARDHVVLCGAGKIGSAAMTVLAGAGKRIVIVEPNPGPDLVRRARDPDVDLLTGDARGDGALDLCDLPHATAFLALTDNDATNLEIALGARARVPSIPLVVRMEDPHFARAAAQLLGIATFSPTALTAPVFAGLSRFPGTRGRIHYGDDDHTIGQRPQNKTPERPPARECTPLCVWRRGELALLRDFEEMLPFDLVLFSVPLAQFRA